MCVSKLLLKDKLRHIRIFKYWFEQTLVPARSTKPEVVMGAWEHPKTGAGNGFREERWELSKDAINWLSIQPPRRLFVMGCP